MLYKDIFLRLLEVYMDESIQNINPLYDKYERDGKIDEIKQNIKLWIDEFNKI